MDNKRDALADYRDERVTITGMFDKFSLQMNSTRQWRVALLQDVYAEVEGKQIDLGHVWVQHAEPLRSLDLNYGDRVKCNCRVTPYKKRLSVPNSEGMIVVENFSLSYPTQIEVVCRVLASDQPATAVPGTVVATTTVPATADPVTVVTATDVPAEQFKKGSVETNVSVSVILDLRQLAGKAGGWQVLRQLIDVLAS